MCVNANTLQIGVWIEAGSRHEMNTNNGVAHLLERLAFKVISLLASYIISVFEVSCVL